MQRTFPTGFLWGASTSSYQIEGGNTHADWCAWEAAGRTPDTCALAADSWNRFRDDVDLARDLGLNAYRISVEWSRIEPARGRFDEDAIAHYAAWLAYAKGRGLSTLVVLWHFTNPQWFADAGGWEWRGASAAFARYAEHVAGALGSLVDLWATVNEANTYAYYGWIAGRWPPGVQHSFARGFAVYDNIASAHRSARAAIKRVLGEQASVGLTHVMPWVHPLGRIAWPSALARAIWTWTAAHRFLDRVSADLDWLGVQYYSDLPFRTFRYDLAAPGPPRTDMGWRICPEGIYHVVKMMAARYRVPLYLTENGLADARDSQRARFLIDHLAWLHRAVAEGIDVRGYFHWSLIDNYEWAYGFAPHFGLASINQETGARRARASARVYEQIARANGIFAGLGEGLRYADGQGPLGP